MNVPYFLSLSQKAIETMQQHGMNTTQIGWILYDIRAAALHEELRRLEQVRVENPPNFKFTGFNIADELNAGIDERENES